MRDFVRQPAEHSRIIRLAPDLIDRMMIPRGLWSETPEEVEAAFAWAQRRDELLRWVRRHLGRRLTRRERRCLELRYFQGLTFQEIGNKTKMDASATSRAVKRALRKLQQATEEDPSWRKGAQQRKVRTRRG